MSRRQDREDAAMAVLVAAMDEQRPACRDDERFIDDDTLPEAVTAICSACALLAACRGYATAQRPTGGIWAGRRWGRRPATEELRSGRRESETKLRGMADPQSQGGGSASSGAVPAPDPSAAVGLPERRKRNGER
jgi:hypothetical protein